MNEFFTNIVISDLKNVFWMFIILLILCHLLVYPKNISRKAWKYVDYIWLGVSIIGLFSLATDVRISTASYWAKMEESRAQNSLQRLKKRYSPEETSYLCRKFDSSDSPFNDIEERQRQNDLRCEWVKKVGDVLTKLNPSNLPQISMNDFPSPTFTGKYELETVVNLKQQITWYSQEREKTIETKNLLSKTGLEKNMFYYSPYLLCFALALRIAKVSGELRHEKT